MPQRAAAGAVAGRVPGGRGRGPRRPVDHRPPGGRARGDGRGDHPPALAARGGNPTSCWPAASSRRRTSRSMPRIREGVEAIAPGATVRRSEALPVLGAALLGLDRLDGLADDDRHRCRGAAPGDPGCLAAGDGPRRVAGLASACGLGFDPSGRTRRVTACLRDAPSTLRRWPVVGQSPRPDDRAGPDDHARRLRGARHLDRDAAGRSRAWRDRAVRLGLLGVLPRFADRDRGRRRGDQQPRPRAAVRAGARACSGSACWSAGWRHRCRCSSRRGSCRVSARGRSRRSPTSRSVGACRSRSGRGCSPRCRRPGSCPACSGPAIAATIGETFSWRFVFLGLLPLIAAVRGADARRAARRRGRAGPCGSRSRGVGRGSGPPPARDAGRRGCRSRDWRADVGRAAAHDRARRNRPAHRDPCACAG